MRRSHRAAIAAALLTMCGLLPACADGPAPPGEARIEVDTPELRELKASAGIEDCAPGSAEAGALPDLTLPCLGGGPDVDLTTLEGPLVVNLWASWCTQCIEEMPAIQAFAERYAEVGVLGIDYQDRQPMAALELARDSGVTYPLLADPGGDLNAADPVAVIRGLPYFLFVAEDGEVTTVPGGIDSVAELAELAEQHLGIDL